MSHRPTPLIALLLTLGATACGGSEGATAYERGDFDAAYEAFAVRTSPEMRFNAALAALQAGRLRDAATALDGTTSDEPDVAALCEFLRGNVAFAQCEQAAIQADTPEAEPFAFDIALRHAESARDSWQDAAMTRLDWPAARRNVERALAQIDVLLQKRGAAAQRKNPTEPGAPPRPMPIPAPPEGEGAEGSAKQPDAPGEATTEDGATAGVATTELSRDQVLLLLDTLAAKEREKRDVRRARQRDRTSEVERDW